MNLICRKYYHYEHLGLNGLVLVSLNFQERTERMTWPGSRQIVPVFLQHVKVDKAVYMSSKSH